MTIVLLLCIKTKTTLEECWYHIFYLNKLYFILFQVLKTKLKFLMIIDFEFKSKLCHNKKN